MYATSTGWITQDESDAEIAGAILRFSRHLRLNARRGQLTAERRGLFSGDDIAEPGGMPLELQFAEEHYHDRHRISQPLELVGCVATFGEVFNAGYLDAWGNAQKHYLYRGCFDGVESAPLRLDHGDTNYGVARLWTDHVGLWCSASIVDPDLIELVLSGQVVGMSPMLLPTDTASVYAGVTRHRRCGVEEVSLCTKTPGNTNTCVVPVCEQEPDAIRQSAMLTNRRGDIIHQLFRHREAILV